MAKKKKRAAAKKKVEPKKNSGFWQLVSAIALIIAGVILAFGAFIDAPIPKGFWDGSWWALGIGTIIVPVCRHHSYWRLWRRGRPICWRRITYGYG
jgi:O-antigen/teichoic acid export membrane protein